MFQSSMGFSETADLMVKLLVQKSYTAAVIYLGYTKIAITLQPVDAMFGYTEVYICSR